MKRVWRDRGMEKMGGGGGEGGRESEREREKREGGGDKFIQWKKLM